ncbi:DUF1993 family protein [Agrobacterium sp. UNC420CL41Cvi]
MLRPSRAVSGSKAAYGFQRLIFHFSLPNFHFHALTARHPARILGVPVGRGDYQRQLCGRSVHHSR